MKLTLEQYHSMIKTRSIGFIGVGVSHRELIRQYAAAGARLTVRDRRSLEELGDFGRELTQMGVRLMLGADYLRDITEEVLFRTPGMKFYTPELTEARRRGVAVTSELELFLALCPCPVYGITGSDGKTTSTTLIAELLRRSGRTVHLGGNIGHPLLCDTPEIAPEDMAVLELSSFQLMTMQTSPHIAVTTNLAPNHLDVHKDYQEYVDAKANIFTHQNAGDIAVFNADNDDTVRQAAKAVGEVRWFSRKQRVDNGVFCENGVIYEAVNGAVMPIMETKDILLPGVHNIENYMAAFAAVRGMVSYETMREIAKTFGGVEHRIELIRTRKGVRWYNDSIGSSPSRTIAGLNAFEKPVILIAGGYDKHIPYAPLGPVAAKTVKAAILMGATADAIEAAIRAHADLPIYRVYNMEEAVQKAAAIAGQGDIVFMSPASASFDMYPNFEVRGNHFKDLVQALPAV